MRIDHESKSNFVIYTLSPDEVAKMQENHRDSLLVGSIDLSDGGKQIEFKNGRYGDPCQRRIEKIARDLGFNIQKIPVSSESK